MTRVFQITTGEWLLMLDSKQVDASFNSKGAAEAAIPVERARRAKKNSMNNEEKIAYQHGYRTFQVRRGINPYVTRSPAWQAYENGWCQAFMDKAPDLSREELQRRADGQQGDFPAYHRALRPSQEELGKQLAKG